MKRLLTLLLILHSALFTLQAHAASKDKETRKVLDTAAERLSKGGGIELKFTAMTLMGKAIQDKTTGSMTLQGRKFTMQTPEMQTWFDGKLQWTMQTGDDEVSLSEPTGAELQAINPYAFLSIYKHGFNYGMKKGRLSNGKEGFRITLKADNAKQEIREMFIEIDNQYNLVRASLRQGKSQWVRLVVNSMTMGKKYPDSHFTFPKGRYPNAEIIDLR